MSEHRPEQPRPEQPAAETAPPEAPAVADDERVRHAATAAAEEEVAVADEAEYSLDARAAISALAWFLPELMCVVVLSLVASVCTDFGFTAGGWVAGVAAAAVALRCAVREVLRVVSNRTVLDARRGELAERGLATESVEPSDQVVEALMTEVFPDRPADDEVRP